MLETRRDTCSQRAVMHSFLSSQLSCRQVVAGGGTKK